MFGWLSETGRVFFLSLVDWISDRVFTPDNSKDKVCMCHMRVGGRLHEKARLPCLVDHLSQLDRTPGLTAQEKVGSRYEPQSLCRVDRFPFRKYWCKPSLESLRAANFRELLACHELTSLYRDTRSSGVHIDAEQLQEVPHL